jgi:hypothetical protein
VESSNTNNVYVGNAMRIVDGTTMAASNTAAVKAASTSPSATDPALVVTLSPNSSGHIKGTIQPLYGTNGQALTITLTNLGTAAGSNARSSVVVNNTTTLYEDVLLFVKFGLGATISTTPFVNIYGYASVDNGTNYAEGITGVDGYVTLTSPPNLVLLAQINGGTTASAVKTYGPFSFCRTYGMDRLPAYWGVVFYNQTGGQLSATAGDFLIEYQGINGQIV